MKLIPASNAEWMIAIASSWPWFPQAPEFTAPRQIGLTLTRRSRDFGTVRRSHSSADRQTPIEDRCRRARSGPAHVECQVGDRLAQLADLHAVFSSPARIHCQIAELAERNHRRERDQAAIADRELGSVPELVDDRARGAGAHRRAERTPCAQEGL